MPFKPLMTLQFTRLAGAASFMMIVAGCTSPAPVHHTPIQQPPLPPASIASPSPAQPPEPRVIGLAEEIERNAIQMTPQ